MNKKNRFCTVRIFILFVIVQVAMMAIETPLQESPLPTPKQLWERCRDTLPPLKYDVINDEVITSDTDPSQKLRKIEIRFINQEINGVKMGHDAIIFIPSNPVRVAIGSP